MPNNNNSGWTSTSLRRRSMGMPDFSAIDKIEDEISALASKIAQANARGERPSTIAAMQSALSSLQNQLDRANRNAALSYRMKAADSQFAAQMRGSVGKGGRGGRPNPSDIQAARIADMFAAMYSGGSGSGRMW